MISKRVLLLAFVAALIGRSPSAGAISFQWDENPWPGAPGSIEVTTNDGNGSDNGTATVLFDQEITELQIQYRNDPAGGGNQWIGISKMSFIEAPEPEALALMSLGLLGLAVAGRRPQGNRT